MFNIEAPLVTENELNGIIYKLKNELKVNPINDGYVIPSAIRDNVGTPSILVNWDSLIYQAGPGSATNLPWIQLSFPKGYIFPTAYSMRGVYETNTGRTFAIEWNVYGIFEGDENSENKWELLVTNNNTESTYCNTLYNSGYQDERVGTFTLPKIPTKGYRHSRWREKTPNIAYYYFVSSGLDIYGTYSSSPTLNSSPTQNINKKQYSCYYSFAIYRLIISSLLGNMIIKL
jgi:hypothetical protein